MMDFDKIADGIYRAVQERMASAIAPLNERIKALESELATLRAAAPPGVSGAMIDRDGELIVTTVRGDLVRLGRVVGKDADPVDVAAIVGQVLAQVGADTKVPDVAAITADIESRVLRSLQEGVAKAVADHMAQHQGNGGRGATIDDLRPAVRDEVAMAVKALPPAEPGKSVTMADVAPMIQDEIRRAVEALPGPIGIGGGMIDRDGELILTTSKGETIRAGKVVGKDGADFTDVEIDYDGERTLIIRGKGGEIRKHLPIPIDRGYWRDGMTCEKGDIVTHDGSAWIALSSTRERPGIALKDQWRMLARKGRDGSAKPVKIEE